jgi:ADP-dependent NAD(P)H-hydrate dehydratase
MDGAPPADGSPLVVTPPLLRARPLPDPGGESDKSARGQAVIVGGSTHTAGAVALAGVAALRAGAGKLRLATAADAAASLSVAVPEAFVAGLPTDDDGALDPHRSLEVLERVVASARAVVFGTGTLDPDATGELLRGLVGLLDDDTALVVDAAALPVLAEEPELLGPVASRTVVVPNPKEAAGVLGRDLEEVQGDLPGALHNAVSRLGCVVALRAPETWIAGPGVTAHVDHSGHPALGTSGSGDVFTGVLGGLLARGADPLTATLWAVQVHGRAGEQAAARIGGLGILARELLDEVPAAMAALAARPA